MEIRMASGEIKGGAVGLTAGMLKKIASALKLKLLLYILHFKTDQKV
jgi:hypothetical protein